MIVLNEDIDTYIDKKSKPKSLSSWHLNSFLVDHKQLWQYYLHCNT